MIDLQPSPAVVVARRVPAEALGDRIGRSIQQVRTSVSAAGVPSTGAPFVRYLSGGPDFSIEVGLPLDGPHSIPGLRTTLLPGGTAASLWHVGPYDGLREAFRRLEDWVDANAEPAGDPWEWYWTEHDADPPRTQIVWPVIPT